MEKIYSKINPDILLHIINRKIDITSQRRDLIPENEHLQVACFSENKDKQLKSHRHIEQVRTTGTTQESWIVIEGSIRIRLYDLDDTIIKEDILNRGDCLITLRGGHDYTVLEQETTIYEYKTGPYPGKGKDNVSIDKQSKNMDDYKFKEY